MDAQKLELTEELKQKIRYTAEDYGQEVDEGPLDGYVPVSLVVDTKGTTDFINDSVSEDEVKKYPLIVRRDTRVILEEYAFVSFDNSFYGYYEFSSLNGKYYLSKEDAEKVVSVQDYSNYYANWKRQISRQRDTENFLQSSINIQEDTKSATTEFL